MQLNGALSTFDIYGMGAEIPYAKEVITELALQLHKRLSGTDQPIDIMAAKRRYKQRRKR